MVNAFVAGQKLFMTIDLDVLGEDKLNGLQKQLMMTGKAGRQGAMGMTRMSSATDEASKSAKQGRGQFGKFFSLGMNILFLGMALNMVFGRMAGSMLSMTGAAAAWKSGVQTVLLPFFIAITPLVIELSMALMGLPRPIKMVIGALVGLLALLGPLMMAMGQLLLLSMAVEISFGTLLLALGGVVLAFSTLVLAILFINKVFKKFGPIVGFIATVLAATLLPILGPLAAGILAIFGAFKAVNKIFKKFGNLVGTIATIVAVAIAALLAPIIGLPVAVALALGAVIAWFWNMKKEIGAALGKVWKFLTTDLKKTLVKFGRIMKKWFVNAVKEKIQAVKNFFKGLKTFFKGIGQILGGNFTEGLANVIKGAKSMIISAINTILPLGLTVGKIASFMGGVAGRAQDIIGVNDFIITGGGRLIEPHKNDTIIGTKNPEQLGGGGGQVTVNINDPVMKDEVDVQNLVDEVERRVDQSTRGRGLNR